MLNLICMEEMASSNLTNTYTMSPCTNSHPGQEDQAPHNIGLTYIIHFWNWPESVDTISCKPFMPALHVFQQSTPHKNLSFFFSSRRRHTRLFAMSSIANA